MKKILNTINRWLAQFKANRREINSNERIAEIRDQFQLTASNGKAYIAHKGVGVKELDPTMQISCAVAILEKMKEDAVGYIRHEENLI